MLYCIGKCGLESQIPFDFFGNSVQACVQKCKWVENLPASEGVVASELGSGAEVWADDTLSKMMNSITGEALPPKNISLIPLSLLPNFLFENDTFYVKNSPQALLEDTGTRLRTPGVRF
jgi:hypothetical protein